MAIEDIAHLVEHANPLTTEKIYRKELRPVLNRGAAAMDNLFVETTATPESGPADPSD